MPDRRCPARYATGRLAAPGPVEFNQPVMAFKGPGRFSMDGAEAGEGGTRSIQTVGRGPTLQACYGRAESEESHRAGDLRQAQKEPGHPADS